MQNKNAAYELVIPFVDALISRVGVDSIRSSSWGLTPDNMNLSYRSCQRAGRNARANVVVRVQVVSWCVTQVVVLYCNLKNFHLATALQPEDVPCHVSTPTRFFRSTALRVPNRRTAPRNLLCMSLVRAPRDLPAAQSQMPTPKALLNSCTRLMQPPTPWQWAFPQILATCPRRRRPRSRRN